MESQRIDRIPSPFAGSVLDEEEDNNSVVSSVVSRATGETEPANTDRETGWSTRHDDEETATRVTTQSGGKRKRDALITDRRAPRKTYAARVAERAIETRRCDLIGDISILRCTSGLSAPLPEAFKSADLDKMTLPMLMDEFRRLKTYIDCQTQTATTITMLCEVTKFIDVAEYLLKFMGFKNISLRALKGLDQALLMHKDILTSQMLQVIKTDGPFFHMSPKTTLLCTLIMIVIRTTHDNLTRVDKPVQATLNTGGGPAPETLPQPPLPLQQSTIAAQVVPGPDSSQQPPKPAERSMNWLESAVMANKQPNSTEQESIREVFASLRSQSATNSVNSPLRQPVIDTPPNVDDNQHTAIVEETFRIE